MRGLCGPETLMGRAPYTSPVAKKERPIILYPAYFDLGRSRTDGRRVAKKWAVESPTVEEIIAAAKALGLEPGIDAEKAFPTSHWRREGRVLVRADYFKTSVVQKVAQRIKQARSA